ncbi:hypothetical protein N7516_007342 [Penicillium verrucosum]|uniref:uncharacterized protein n=1 Tax=Penicillium verrucosum TaxID=60171 RepID=UPI0025459669|nr:uncharacterized protein N7516_007342 [Penicillium verrucosum]KAJ5932853.1 hypothetical protein N7516_007342 [Penicillium verrucosum]
MNAQPQPSLRDQLFKSTALVLEIIRKLEPTGLVDLSALEEGMRSLQTHYWAPYGFLVGNLTHSICFAYKSAML